MYNIWGVDLAVMQLISKYNRRFYFLLCAIDGFSKYASVIPVKRKTGKTIFTAFQKISDEENRKPSKRKITSC